ncbi:MAG: hypothetical protein GX418_16140 [Clostridiales bacterium]|nr:hypothetical protein [Clostridiales bacterium]
MQFLSNAHTHTTYCDGRSTVAEQLAAAQALGFVSLGFSGHAMQGFDWDYCMSAEGQRAYRAALRGLQASLAARGQAPRLYVGLEQDSLVPEAQKRENRADFDYLIGSTHYFPEPPGGMHVAVDGAPELLEQLVRARFDGDPQAMAAAYFALHGETVRRDRPDLIGHFDLVRKHAARLRLDTDAPVYRRAALDALSAAFEGCRVLEVNTGNIARGYDVRPYPADFLLDAWQDMGGELTLTSDCHHAPQLDCAFEETVRALRTRGWKRLLRLGTGVELWEEVTL